MRSNRILAFVAGLAVCGNACAADAYTFPADLDFVPDATTAVAVATVYLHQVMSPRLFARMTRHAPLEAERDGDVWRVSPHRRKPACRDGVASKADYICTRFGGGALTISIARHDGQVRYFAFSR